MKTLRIEYDTEAKTFLILINGQPAGTQVSLSNVSFSHRTAQMPTFFVDQSKEKAGENYLHRFDPIKDQSSVSFRRIP